MTPEHKELHQVVKAMRRAQKVAVTYRNSSMRYEHLNNARSHERGVDKLLAEQEVKAVQPPLALN